MKIKGNMTENFTIEAVGRAYELDLISMPEAREMIRRIWGTDIFLPEEKK
jgi:hypothetical protein